MEALSTVLNWYQMYLKLTASIWEDMVSQIKLYDLAEWFNVTHQFLHKSDLHLIIPHMTIPIHFKNNKAIMEMALNWAQNPVTLKAINNS